MALDIGAAPWLGTVSIDSAALDIVKIMKAKHLGFYDDAFGTDINYWERIVLIQRMLSHS
ncbi:MAG: hypothetical protein KKE44_14540 [Proteobacteria bacterium]|nr:hypothetical protein [Pseudomonadota bacterium]MBU1583945.1 hypothetical protein [Pseudomonadota bacterium]MBU2454967.1 hypothetical protein [Pseudomonadota bacterium]MBU2629499.1 hypothetical protein [Pseudomonadota bacterium]